MCMRVLYFFGGFVMKSLKRLVSHFSKGELLLWCSSVILIAVSFCVFDRENLLTLAASLVGVTSLIFNAKGNPFGQFLMMIFSLPYGIISFTFSYYGEMLTYLGMTMPMAVFALISWLKNPHNGNKAEVKVNSLGKKEIVFIWIAAVIVTVAFYFVLDAFNTANIVPSTISVTTSFAAVYLTFRRSPFYALGYAANDVVLIVLWVLASVADARYISVVVCFVAFLINDIYGFLSWRKMKERQQAERRFDGGIIS